MLGSEVYRGFYVCQNGEDRLHLRRKLEKDIIAYPTVYIFAKTKYQDYTASSNTVITFSPQNLEITWVKKNRL